MNTRIISAIALGCCLCACGNPPEKEETHTEPVPVMPESTAYTVQFDRSTLPAGFDVDSIQVEDTIKRVKIHFHYVIESVSEDYEYTGVMLKTLLDHAKKEFTFYDIPTDPEMNSDIVYVIDDFSAGNKFISIRFVADSYTYGAAHHNYEWYTVNYNRETRRCWWLKDIFQFRSGADSLRFIQMVERNLDHADGELARTNDSMAVYIKNDNMYWISPPTSWVNGLRTAKLPLDSVWNFLRERPD